MTTELAVFHGASPTTQPWFKSVLRSRLFAASMLFAAVCLLYGAFLRNPLVFDDLNFFNGADHPEYLKISNLGLRWLSYGTLEWTEILFGSGIVWFRIGNMAIHAATAIMLFLWLHKLFSMALPEEGGVVRNAQAMPLFWLAFSAALIFALHPAAVYAAAYLIQRSILMATFFTLLMWYLFLRGVEKGSQFLLIASAGAFLLAELSKEHAIMAPAAVIPMLYLIRQPSRSLLKQVLPAFLLYGAVGLFVLYQIKSANILGHAYEPRGDEMLALLAGRSAGFDSRLAYPLSVLTQALLFFKYLWVWIVPSPAWMSVDMFEEFATRFTSFPYLLGLAGFIAYPLLALRLLRRRGRAGLLGLAMLFPWLLFATELVTVRIQETFVLYRSYVWMPGLFAAFPFLFENVAAKRTAALFCALLLCLLPISWGRLQTFSAPLLLWNDAARLIQGKDERPGVDRIYHNRGLQLALLGYDEEALRDLSKAVSLNPRQILAFNDRAATYMKRGEYAAAISDYDKAIALNPAYARAYLGRAFCYEKLNNIAAARKDYEKMCSLGYAQACRKAASQASG